MVDAFFAAEIDPNIPTIDLHNTNNPHDAMDQFERELARIAVTDAAYVRVIHGIGTGVLKAQLEQIFVSHPLVVEYQCESHGGSTILLL